MQVFKTFYDKLRIMICEEIERRNLTYVAKGC